MQLNFSDYTIGARYAGEVNAGYSSNLYGISDCPYRDGEDLVNRQSAWKHGHDQAQRHLSGCA